MYIAYQVILIDKHIIIMLKVKHSKSNSDMRRVWVLQLKQIN
jgi:hypothetical protein